MRVTFGNIPQAFVLMLILPISSISQISNAYDIFPLSINRTYTYSYEYRDRELSLIYLVKSTLDSGTVQYVVLDSLTMPDSTVCWSISQRENLFHQRLKALSWPAVDTTVFWTIRDTTVFLTERLAGRHELICSSLVWFFPLSRPLQAVYRYADLPISSFNRKDTTLYLPASYVDTLWFEASRGLHSRRSYTHYGYTAPIDRSLKVVLLSTSTLVTRPELLGDHPREFQLSQNYPNPFNPSTQIRYSLLTRNHVQLRVFNVIGQILAELVNAEQDAGWNQVVWNANVSSGLYLYMLEAVSVNDPSRRFVDVKKMVVLR